MIRFQKRQAVTDTVLAGHSACALISTTWADIHSSASRLVDYSHKATGQTFVILGKESEPEYFESVLSNDSRVGIDFLPVDKRIPPPEVNLFTSDIDA